MSNFLQADFKFLISFDFLTGYTCCEQTMKLIFPVLQFSSFAPRSSVWIRSLLRDIKRSRIKDVQEVVTQMKVRYLQSERLNDVFINSFTEFCIMFKFIHLWLTFMRKRSVVKFNPEMKIQFRFPAKYSQKKHWINKAYH